MKVMTALLALFLFVLAIKPCSDGNNVEDKRQEQITLNHNHQNDADDSCPIMCICSCCGITITYEPIEKIELREQHPIPNRHAFAYTAQALCDFSIAIWQPPQLIS